MDADNQLFHMVGRIEGKIDRALTEQERAHARLDKVESRVDTLEALKHKAQGSMKVIIALWTALAAAAGALYEITKGYIFK